MNYKSEEDKMTRSIIRFGSSNGDVKYLQQSLTKLGYSPGPVDGIFGFKTETAVKLFQKTTGLIVDGVVGNNTWTAIGNALMPTAYLGTLIYTVVNGDTLYTISHNYNSTIENVLKFNTIPDPTLIHLGQIIVIPLSPPEAIIYTVKSGDSLNSIAIKFGTSVNNLSKYNYLNPPYVIYPKQQLVVTASLK
jgi:LysM repeat protein